jgi:hypothetical protein
MRLIWLSEWQLLWHQFGTHLVHHHHHHHLFTFRRSLFGNNMPLDVEIVIHIIKKLRNCNYSFKTLCDIHYNTLTE